YDKMEVVGRGGTDLRAVRKWIIKNRPKAMIIFTDMGCEAMEPLEPSDMVPILWIVFNNPTAIVPHGKVIHIQE
ncbi:VWA-like domain-containing protein, partial [Streptomyces sp. P17]|uniref:VWA-like domain-containing protein n=1 Tax=Streptomyces sp. P17 TaxID=3074716 RepID=UPI0028F45D9C